MSWRMGGRAVVGRRFAERVQSVTPIKKNRTFAPTLIFLAPPAKTVVHFKGNPLILLLKPLYST
eukprot:663012-Prymnesium_polylepis.1